MKRRKRKDTFVLVAVMLFSVLLMNVLAMEPQTAVGQLCEDHINGEVMEDLSFYEFLIYWPHAPPVPVDVLN